MARLIIISNRLPFTLDKTGDDIAVRQSSGGLVSAIKSYLDHQVENLSKFSEQVWVGTLDASEEDWKKVRETGAISYDYGIEPIFTDKKLYDDYYNGFSNSTLWPLFHYFPSLVEFKKEYFEAYIKINRAFAAKLVEIYQPGDVFWVHDYQLMVLPRMLRKRIPGSSIGFFLHIPFPSYEIFRMLPTNAKRQLLTGILGADLIGFHTYDYMHHFIQSVKMVLKVDSQFNTITHEGRILKVDLFPIGIDYQKFRKAIVDDAVSIISSKLEERFFGMKIIFSVDRLDYTKGVNYRLEAFQQFLEVHPEWREQVIFIMNVIPSRDFIQTYVERRRQIEEKVSAINGRFSTLNWQPVIYRYNHLSFEELCGLYQVADIALITPLRDGMNLVAKEYIASCIDKGVLILSELTGAASELNEALLVNPTDTEEVVNALTVALNMPLTEQRSRLSYMQRRIADYDVHKWINDFFEQLMNIKKEQEKQKVKILDAQTKEKMLSEFYQAKKRCILLDYDGTLTPFQKLPSLATPGNELLQLLEELTRDDANEVTVISGRDNNILEKWLGHLPLTLVAEHGAFIRYKNQEWQEQVTQTNEWKEEIRPLMQLFVARCAGSFIEEKKNTIAWHYRNTDPDFGFVRSRELRNSLLQLTANTPLQVVDGNRVIEVRLIGVDKGTMALKILDHFSPDFAICLGDDATDEDMFRMLREKSYTIKIGNSTTAAQYTLWSQSDVLPFLRRFLQPAESPHLTTGSLSRTSL
jgi:trehalose 6-phosphate synthase/phosphatase